MDYDQQYYVITEDEYSGTYMLNESRKSDEKLGINLLSEHSIQRWVKGRGHVQITWGDDGKFSPCDYHRVSATGLVSHKFKDVLEALNLNGVDFYETDIENNGNIWRDHFLMHIWQNHQVLHRERSKIKGSYVDNDFTLEKISLDEKVLDKIPLEERLVFRINEDVKYLYHESVVAVLEAAGLKGMGFVKVADWSVHGAFDEDDFYDSL